MRHHDDSHDDKLNHMKLWDIVVIAGSLGLSLFVCICVGVAKSLVDNDLLQDRNLH